MLVGTLPFLLHVRMVKLKASYWAKCSSTKGFCFRKLLVWEKIMASPDSNLRSIFCIILLFINKVRQAFKLKCFKWINRHKQTMFTFKFYVLNPLIFIHTTPLPRPVWTCTLTAGASWRCSGGPRGDPPAPWRSSSAGSPPSTPPWGSRSRQFSRMSPWICF